MMSPRQISNIEKVILDALAFDESTLYLRDQLVYVPAGNTSTPWRSLAVALLARRAYQSTTDSIFRNGLPGCSLAPCSLMAHDANCACSHACP
jgi:hypothetical protein